MSVMMMMMMMESPVGTTYELQSHSLLPVGPRMTDKADSCSELSTTVITGNISIGLLSQLQRGPLSRGTWPLHIVFTITCVTNFPKSRKIVKTCVRYRGWNVCVDTRAHTHRHKRRLKWFYICPKPWIASDRQLQCLTGQAPAYLADDCQLTSDVCLRRLRSTDTAICIIRRSNNSFGDRCFADAGPRLWNTLPVHLQQCDSLGEFKWLLKTHLFGVRTAVLCDTLVWSAI